VPVPTKPYTFTAATQAQSAQVNADFDALFTWADGGVDNTNVGAAGFFASQILPQTNAQALFASPVGWMMRSTALPPNQVVLTVAAPTGQNTDLADFTVNGITKFAINAGGIPSWDGGTGVCTTDVGSVTNGMLAGGIAQSKLAAFAGVAVGGALTTATTGAFANSVGIGGATPGTFTLDATVNASAADGIRLSGFEPIVRFDSTAAAAAGRNWAFSNGNTNPGYFELRTSSAKGGDPINAGLDRLVLDPTGALKVASNGAAGTAGTLGYVPPVYTAAGAATASTLHGVLDSVSASGTTTTVTFTNAAAFSTYRDQMRLVDVSASPYVRVTPTADTLNSFTFASTTGHTYVFSTTGI
jgi:hypothetical protein